MLNKSDLLSYKTNDSKKLIFDAFSSHFSGLVLSKRVVDATLQKMFLSSLYQFNSIFSGLVWTDKLHSCVEGIYLLNTGCYGNGKMTLFQLSWQKFQREKNI